MSSIVHGKLENQVVHYHTTMLRACMVMSHDNQCSSTDTSREDHDFVLIGSLL